MKNDSLSSISRAAACSLLLVLAFSGCALFRKDGQRMQYLIGEPGSSTAASSGAPGLHVRPIHASLPFTGQDFVYRTGDNTFESDYYNGFFVPPGDMFTEATRNVLYSGTFVPASQFERTNKPQYILEGWIDAIYGDFRNPERPIAVLEMRFTLFKSDRPEMRMMKRYSQEIPLQSKNPEALVDAWNVAWNKISTQLRADLRAKTL